MSDLPILAATLLANFATVRIPRCESLWISSVPDLSPKHRYRSLARALAGENLIMKCHRQHLEYRLLEEGHRAFFDRVEGGGQAGWRLHFFCLDQTAVSVLYNIGVGECGPGHAVTFDPEQFVMHRLSQLGRTGPQHPRWMVGLGPVKAQYYAVIQFQVVSRLLRMVCLSESNSVIVFGIYEARRNLRPIKS